MKRFWTVLGVILLVGVLAGASCSVGVLVGAALGGNAFSGIGRDTVAVVYVEGTIQGGESSGLFASGGAYSDQIVRWLQRAERDPAVKAVVLRVDSPGGGVTASDEIRNQIVKLKATKPVVASMGSLAASGGYYVSAPATKIVTNETTLTGSIGVITIVPNLEGLMEKLGIGTTVFTSGPHKDETAGLRPLTEADRKILQDMVSEAFDRFVSIVSEGRAMSKEAVRKLADGRIYTGKQALELGLADRVGDLPEAIRVAADLGGIRGEARVVRYRSGGFFSSASSAILDRLGLPPLTSLSGGSKAPFSVQYLYLVP